MTTSTTIRAATLPNGDTLVLTEIPMLVAPNHINYCLMLYVAVHDAFAQAGHYVEYFEAFDRARAIEAFGKRLNSDDPTKLSGMGVDYSKLRG